MKKLSILTALALLGLAQAAYTGPKVEISFVHGYSASDRDVVEGMIKDFNAKNPNITVKGQLVPWGTTWQQLPSLVAAGRAPDVVAMTENVIGNFMARRALSRISSTELSALGVNQRAYYPAFWNAGRYNGVLYGIPFSNAAQVMYYNKDLMKKYGIAGVPKTRDEFIKAAQACTVDKAGNKATEADFKLENVDTYGAGAPTPWMGGTLAYGVLRSNGGDLLDAKKNAGFATPEGEDAVQFIVDWSAKYKISPAKLTEGSDINTFKAGKSCFNFNGVWQLTNYGETKGLNFGVAPLPQFGSKRPAAWGASVHMVLPVQKAGYDANKRLASLEFAKYMTSASGNLAWTKSGALPTQAAVAGEKEFTGSAMGAMGPALKDLYIPTGFAWIDPVRGAWDQAIEAAMLGKKSVKQALEDAQKEAQVQVDAIKAQVGAK